MNSMDFTLAGGGGCTQGGRREGREGAQSSAGQRGAHQGESSRESERRFHQRVESSKHNGESLRRAAQAGHHQSTDLFRFCLEPLVSDTAYGQDQNRTEVGS